MKLRDPRTIGNAAVSIALLYFMQETANAFIRREAIPDFEPEDEEEQGLTSWAIERSFLLGTGTVPILGGIARYGIDKLHGKPFGYSLSPVEIYGESIVDGVLAGADVIQHVWSEYGGGEETDVELDANTAKDIVAALALAKGLPATQPKRIIDAVIAYSEDADDWSLLDLLTGYDEDRAKE